MGLGLEEGDGIAVRVALGPISAVGLAVADALSVAVGLVVGVCVPTDVPVGLALLRGVTSGGRVLAEASGEAVGRGQARSTRRGSAVAALGILRRVLTGGDRPVQRAALVSAAAAVALVIGAALAFFAAYLDQPYAPPPQGRYLFAAWGPVCLLLTAGLAAWLPPARQWAALKALMAGLLILDGVVLLGLVVPFYYR